MSNPFADIGCLLHYVAAVGPCTGLVRLPPPTHRSVRNHLRILGQSQPSNVWTRAEGRSASYLELLDTLVTRLAHYPLLSSWRCNSWCSSCCCISWHCSSSTPFRPTTMRHRRRTALRRRCCPHKELIRTCASVIWPIKLMINWSMCETIPLLYVPYWVLTRHWKHVNCSFAIVGFIMLPSVNARELATTTWHLMTAILFLFSSSIRLTTVRPSIDVRSSVRMHHYRSSLRHHCCHLSAGFTTLNARFSFLFFLWQRRYWIVLPTARRRVRHWLNVRLDRADDHHAVQLRSLLACHGLHIRSSDGPTTLTLTRLDYGNAVRTPAAQLHRFQSVQNAAARLFGLDVCLHWSVWCQSASSFNGLCSHIERYIAVRRHICVQHIHSCF